MAGLRVLLSGARRSGDADRIRAAMDEAIELLEHGIADLRALITDLRPAALDELGPQAALETLADRVAQQSGLEIDLQVDLAFERGDAPARHVTEIESTIYRLVQEGLTNVGQACRGDACRGAGERRGGDGRDPASRRRPRVRSRRRRGRVRADRHARARRARPRHYSGRVGRRAAGRPCVRASRRFAATRCGALDRLNVRARQHRARRLVCHALARAGALRPCRACLRCR